MNKQPSTVKILVVDDQPEVVEQLCEYLELHGYACTPANSAMQGIERYQADEQIGLVLCDLHLPRSMASRWSMRSRNSPVASACSKRSC